VATLTPEVVSDREVTPLPANQQGDTSTTPALSMWVPLALAVLWLVMRDEGEFQIQFDDEEE
jgi:hypothetical protein